MSFPDPSAIQPPSEPPLVSIIMPVHNGARAGQGWLQRSLLSCIQQTFTDWELIVQDDASTDNTPAIIREFAGKDNRVSYRRNETNLRTPGTLNAGFAAARGTYFTWTSDDNLFRPTALERMASFLDSNSDVDIVYADFDLIDDEDKLIQPVRVGEPDELANECCVGA